MTATIERVYDQATLLPSGGAYTHGFAYQALTSFLASVAGLPVEALQRVVWPFLAAAGVAAAAFAFYRWSVGPGAAAALAGLLLFMQGDMLFVTLRGSHENLDWPLMMVALILLYGSVGRSLPAMVPRVLLFYLVVFAMMATNLFFASTFIVAVLLSLLLGLGVFAFLRRRLSLATDLRRLAFVTLSCAVLFFLFMFYLYPPALHELRILHSTVDQVVAMFLSFEVKGNPYASIAVGWVDQWVYLGLTAFTWLLIVLSFAEWLWQGQEMLRGRRSFGLRQSLAWLLYAAFAIQVALSVVVDLSGVLAQNLQLRLFPGFTVLAVAFVARGVHRVLASPRFPTRLRRPALGLAALFVTWFAVAALFKATNEPLLSNKWTFYTPAEDAALRWVDGNLREARVWTGIDERFQTIFYLRYATRSESENRYYAYLFRPESRYALISERERLRGIRLGIAMPSVLDWNRVYDSSDAYLYHRRARTPYQK